MMRNSENSFMNSSACFFFFSPFISNENNEELSRDEDSFVGFYSFNKSP